MTQLTQAVDIQAPPERVYDHLTSPDKLKRWAQGVEEVSYVSGAPRQVGARFKQRVREGGRVNEYDGEVLAAEPPSHSRVRVARGPITLVVDYRLSERNGGTHLEQTVELQSKNPVARFFGRLFAFFTRGLMRRQLDQLKRVVEQAGSG